MASAARTRYADEQTPYEIEGILHGDWCPQGIFGLQWQDIRDIAGMTMYNGIINLY